MKFDIFFSICQTEVDGFLPSEAEMLSNFFSQVNLADRLGYGTAWIAETHLSCEIQKSLSTAVIPHFTGEIGLNTDVLQLAHKVFATTRSIHVGSAIRNILCNGGPIAHAEAISTFLYLHGHALGEQRLLEIGFAQGRFDFCNRPYGIAPRNKVEEVAWPVVKGKIFAEAVEIFLRLLRGEIISSDDISPQYLLASDFRSQADWINVCKIGGEKLSEIPLAKRWTFERLGIIPKEIRRELLRLTIGTHDPKVQVFANHFLPCGVFNLSITPEKTIEETHQRMQKAFHPDGGKWSRGRMPRTVLIFINDNPALTESEKCKEAQVRAEKAIANYWLAMAGTIDEEKVKNAVENALVGSPEAIARDLATRFNEDDRLMCWFDFNDHNNRRVMQSMETFMTKFKHFIK